LQIDDLTMTVHAGWDDQDQTIIRMEFTGAWTWSEAHTAGDDMIAMMDTVKHTVHVIIDLTNSSRIPPLAFKEVRTLLSKRSPYAGGTVFVGANFMTASLWKTIAQTYGWLVSSNPYSFADTLEEARARIAAMVSTRR
jgi:hypothetical protein